MERDDDDDEKQFPYLGEVELTFTQELSFFVQFFVHLLVLYSTCYLCSMQRFIGEECHQLNARVRRPLAGLRWPAFPPPLFPTCTRQMEASGAVGRDRPQQQQQMPGQLVDAAPRRRPHQNPAPSLTFGQLAKQTMPFRI